MKALFDCTQAHWNKHSQHPRWNDLTLLAVDGVVWRTEDTLDNAEAFARATGTQYPQCQMELSSHLITASAFDSYSVNEMILAEKLIDILKNYKA